MTLSLANNAIQGIATEIEEGLHHHEQWLAAVNRILICQLQLSPEELREDAHHRCAFGRWLGKEGNAWLREHPAFSAINETHRRLHTAATRLFRCVSLCNPIMEKDYDDFLDAVRCFQLQLGSLRQEIADSQQRLDPLTGAYVATSLLPVLREHRERVRRGTAAVTVGVIDVGAGGLDTVEDSPEAADRGLAVSARYLIEHLRPYDTVYRYTDQRLVVCMQDTNTAGAERVARRLCDGLASAQAAGEGQAVCIGLAPLEAEVLVEDTLFRADRAAQTARTAGQGTVEVWRKAAA